MCGIACYLGNNKEEGLRFGKNAMTLLHHRGPDDNGLLNDDNVTLAHTRLSILELSDLGHQPMDSSCGRYTIIFNGEIYNHLELRKKYLLDHPFRGHSDTETIVELFRVRQEKMLAEMIGMWAIVIWDRQTKQIFISRDRFGQKPVYMRRTRQSWLLASEIKPLLAENEHTAYDPTAITEFIALGNYGHTGTHTFFKEIRQFSEGAYAWLSCNQETIAEKKYWEFPDINSNDKVPFDTKTQRQLHDCVVEAVLSQTLSDVPIGITLSGGIDSSIIAGILATYYDKDIHVFTAQTPDSKYDETRYVNAILNKYGADNFILHSRNLNDLSVKNDLENYIKIQEEPFGDTSIIAHGFLMKMAARAGIKVMLNGQGADELFFGYNNMTLSILAQQVRAMQMSKFYDNLSRMKLGNNTFPRIMLEAFFPNLEYKLRTKSRIRRREILNDNLVDNVDNDVIALYKHDNVYNVWKESLYGLHIPHLVHYDDRNSMSCSIEGRMPFLDHRIAECVATIKPTEFVKNGMRKFILREACKQYLPQAVYKRTDKIGFYTPLVKAINDDMGWVESELENSTFLKNAYVKDLFHKLRSKTLNVNEALQVWRCISVDIWMKEYNIN